MIKPEKKPFAIMLLKEQSLRLPKKNFFYFFGKPMFKHIYDAAINSALFKEIIISTESKKIIKLCNKYNIKVFFRRPKKLSSNKSSLNSVIKHAINKCKSISQNSKEFCLLWATSPLVKSSDFRNSYKLYKSIKNTQCVVGVKQNFEYYSTLTEVYGKKFVHPILKKKITSLRKQDLKKKYVINSSFAWINKKKFLKKNDWLLPNTLPYVMDDSRSVDLDYPEDLDLLKFYAKKWKLK